LHISLLIQQPKRLCGAGYAKIVPEGGSGKLIICNCLCRKRLAAGALRANTISRSLGLVRETFSALRYCLGVSRIFTISKW
jgi:hypothetical protein